MDKKRHCKNIVIDGVRSIEEVETIKRLGGKVIYVEARPEVRYERLRKRGAEKDKVIQSFEDFLRMDEEEEKLYHTTKLKEVADYVIVNEGTLEDLREKVEKIILEVVG
ncbi:MAG: dephospho-CoA kinase [Thermococcaceae archaeon]|nr:dephospho-CoA kinase [Thermococcaceae archaeon]